MSSPADQHEIEKKEILKRYRTLLRQLKPRLKTGDAEMIRKAFELAVDAHKTMRRKSGEPYIFHPLAVAQICVDEIGLGPTSVAAALLHDTVEDTEVTLLQLNKLFGEKIANIVDGLTKISTVFDPKTNSIQAENFRKMLLTLSQDVRVILIKLADRLHNMRTIESMSRNTQLKIASETQYIYAPLAHRLGLNAIKTELEDLSLKVTDPKTYKFISDKLSETKLERNRYIRNFIEPLSLKLNESGLKFDIKGRPKSIFSIHKKMQKQGIPFEEVFDLFAIRVIIDTEQDDEKVACWKAYSVVTNEYRSNPDRLRDWVTQPKSNGYESLHATVMGPNDKWVEVQIRTKRMDEIAEKGVAAHWKYKDQSAPRKESGLDEWLARVRSMLENPDSNARDFVDDFAGNFFSEEVYVFTPKGNVVHLPAKATALDFAYEIHSDVGNHCIGAKVNNKLVPLSHELRNGDQVEIITSQKQRPNEDWLQFVVTGKARSRIREFFKDEKRRVAEDGKEILKRKLKSIKKELTPELVDQLQAYFNLQSSLDFYFLLGNGTIKKETLNVREILEHQHLEVLEKRKGSARKDKKEINHLASGLLQPNSIVIDDQPNQNVDYSLANCCTPIPGDDIFAFVTVGEGIKIHRTNCPNAVGLMANYGYRILKARWAAEVTTAERAFLVGIDIRGTDAVGIVSNISNIISKQLQVNMRSIALNTVDGKFDGTIMLYITNLDHLEALMDKLRKVNGVLNVSRINVT